MGIKYQQPLRVYVSVWPENAPASPEDVYREDVRNSEVVSYVEIGGYPGLTVPQGADISNADGLVRFSIGRVEVRLYGAYDADQLVEVAETAVEQSARR